LSLKRRDGLNNLFKYIRDKNIKYVNRCNHGDITKPHNDIF